MKSLYLRIYATVVVVLLLFAFASGWVYQRHIEQERVRVESAFADRMGAWAELIQRSLPGVESAAQAQNDALREWSLRLRLPLALDSASGERLGASDSFLRREADGARSFALHLEDGRTLRVMRPGTRGRLGENRNFERDNRDPRDAESRSLEPRAFEPRGDDARGPGGAAMSDGPHEPHGPMPGPLLPFVPPDWQRGVGLILVLVILFIAVALGAYPVVRRLTRRLEALKRGVEQFGAGELDHRVDVSGSDEVAAVARSFNVAATRVEALVLSHQSLLANASHELRSPLARMKMAVSMLDDASPAQRGTLRLEIDRNVAELDALVEEVLLASRLDGSQNLLQRERVDLIGLAAEEAARVDATVEGPAVFMQADERLLRRAVRNLLENARRYGGGEVSVVVAPRASGRDGVVIAVRDRGPGVPEAMRERIFEPFFRLPGHAEQVGGVGLGLSLVKQIVERHGGAVRCEAREGGGSCFVIELPNA